MMKATQPISRKVLRMMVATSLSTESTGASGRAGACAGFSSTSRDTVVGAFSEVWSTRLITLHGKESCDITAKFVTRYR